MGQIIYDYYLKAAEFGGINARTRLSGITKIPSMQAKSVPDSEANLAMFEKAFQQIKKEFGGTDSPAKQEVEVNKGTTETTTFLRKQITVFSDLLSSRGLYQNDMKKGFERITETLTEAIDVERASVWLYDKDKTQIECADLYERDKGAHSSGVVLKKSDFPNYFKAIENEKTLAANDAHTHAGTSEFSEVYLTPLRINSLLDTPIWVNGEMVGVLCHEHVGPMRKWNRDEENFAYLAGNVTAIIIESNS